MVPSLFRNKVIFIVSKYGGIITSYCYSYLCSLTHSTLYLYTIHSTMASALDQWKCTLDFACRQGHLTIVQHICPTYVSNAFDRNISRSTFIYTSKTFIEVAIDNGRYDIVSYFLSQYPDPNVIRNNVVATTAINNCMSTAMSDKNLDWVQKFLTILTPSAPMVVCKLPNAEKDEKLNSDVKESELCIICKERASCTVITDCGHSNLCVTCARNLVLVQKYDKCPTCRKQMTNIIKIFK